MELWLSDFLNRKCCKREKKNENGIKSSYSNIRKKYQITNLESKENLNNKISAERNIKKMEFASIGNEKNK